MNLGIAISSYYYAYVSSLAASSCNLFKNSMTNSATFSSLPLSTAQNELLTPVQQCTSGVNTYFLQSNTLTTAQTQLLQLQQISTEYN